MDEILTNAETLYSQGFSCEACGYEFSREELQDAIESLADEPFNGITLSCDTEDCDAEYSLDMKIMISEL